MIILWFLRLIEIFPTKYEKGKIHIKSASIFENYFQTNHLLKTPEKYSRRIFARNFACAPE